MAKIIYGIIGMILMHGLWLLFITLKLFTEVRYKEYLTLTIACAQIFLYPISKFFACRRFFGRTRSEVIFVLYSI